MINFNNYESEYNKHYENDFSIEDCLIKERQKTVSVAKTKYNHNSILEVGCGKNSFMKIGNVNLVKFRYSKFFISIP